MNAKELGWEAILLAKPHKYISTNEEKICRYVSRKYEENGLISLDYEILGIINALNTFSLFLNKPFIVRTDCETIVKFYNKTNEKKLSRKRWQNFVNTITGNGYQVIFEHIKSKNNSLADYLSRKVAKFICL